MAYSYQEFDADGLTSSFTVPFDYVKKSEVQVFVDGVETTEFSFPSEQIVTLDTTPPNNVTVLIRRNTDLTNRAVDFVAGAVLSEEDLDTALMQVFNGSQEAIDAADAAVGIDIDGRIDAKNRVIKNVADPVLPNDAANRTWTLSATQSQVAAAQAAQVAALAAQQLAQSFRDQAEGHKNVAATHANRADTEATLSETHKLASLQYRNEAEGLLNAAKIPTFLTGAAGQFLQVKAAENGYELVASVAAPNFVGLRMSGGNSLEMAFNREDDFIADEWTTWMMAENIQIGIINNDLVITL